MKSINDKVLQSRRNALDFSKNASRQSFDILNAPIEVKRKRSITGSYIGIVLMLAGGVSYLVKLYSIAGKIITLGTITLGSNLSILSYLNKKAQKLISNYKPEHTVSFLDEKTLCYNVYEKNNTIT